MPVGRPRKEGERLTERVHVYFSPSQLKELNARADGDLSTFIRGRMMDAAQETIVTEVKTKPVACFGYIHAGDAMTVTHLPEGATVTPPFALNPDCYALIVVGDSMERDYGLSIPDGSYAFFCPQQVAHYGAVVHVEWPCPDASGDHECTLKRYCPNPDGTVTFEPFNPKNKPITKKEGEYSIRGVFVRAWKGEIVQ